MTQRRILGAILAGGESRRFGTDKALALLDGHTLIDRVADALHPHVDAIVIVGRGAIPDRPAPGLGPLGGVAAALHHATAHGFTHILTVPCDTPHLPARMLADLAARDGPCFVPALPVCGLWPASLAPLIDRHIAADPRRSMRGWATAADAWPLPGDWPIANINTPADLAELHAPATASDALGHQTIQDVP